MKTDRRIEKTQQSIRQALISLLSVKGRSQITVKELSEIANINRKTFYSHYANIDDVFDVLEDEILDKLLFILERYDFFDSTLDIHSLFNSLNEVIYEDFDLYEKLVHSESHDFLLIKVKQVLKSTISDKYASKYLHETEMFNFYTEYIASGIMSLYIEWFKSDKSVSLEQLGIAAGIISFSGFSAVIEQLK
jgi:AcrR family transcriptional regulator